MVEPSQSATSLDLENWVIEQLLVSQEAGPHGIEDISEVAAHPLEKVAACTVSLRTAAWEPPTRRIAVVDLMSGDFRFLDLPFADCADATWSPDGRRLALLAAIDGEASQAVVIDPAGRGSVVQVSKAAGSVESCHWAPDGSELALIVADAGAELSDIHGSGLVGPAAADESWRPRVSPGHVGGRVLVVWSPAEDELVKVSDLNAWEAAWCGQGGLVAVTTEDPGEGAWYGAQLTWIDRSGSAERALHTDHRQLFQPRASASGGRWSVLSGVASDRGLQSGALLVGEPNGDPSVLDTAGVDVSDHRWLDERHLLFAGLRGLETVIGVCDIDAGSLRVVWSGPETSGKYQPEVSGSTVTGPVVVMEDHLNPPRLGIIEGNVFRDVLATAGPETSYAAARAGATTAVSWRSTDNTMVQGLLTRPPGHGPHALVVAIHGGPIAAWRNTWTWRDPFTTLLVNRGYAVLRPNPRGSTGRGQAYAEAVLGDMGGMDVDDILTGIESLVEQGLVDSGRIGITGNSYGGFMASWMPSQTEMFAAAVARSPVTDWVTQHLTSNIGEFDRMILRGDVFDPESQYRTRSPLTHHDRITTPILFTAGARDLATPASQAQLLHTALVERGVETQLVIYPEEGHGVRQLRTLADQCARMIAWFERFMPANTTSQTDSGARAD
jgi:dipeptidyl aminopeptidase/acylaminoacyl peptidase